MANPTVLISANVVNNDTILTATLTVNDSLRSGKAFVLSLSDYDGFPDPNQSSSFPPSNNYACGWDLGSSNLANLTGTFKAVIILPEGHSLPNSIDWTLVYSNDETYSTWSPVN